MFRSSVIEKDSFHFAKYITGILCINGEVFCKRCLRAHIMASRVRYSTDAQFEKICCTATRIASLPNELSVCYCLLSHQINFNPVEIASASKSGGSKTMLDQNLQR